MESSIKLPSGWSIRMIQIPSGWSLMYNKESQGPKMEPWGTLTLMGYFHKDFPSRTKKRYQLFMKWQNKAKYLTWISIRFRFVKKNGMSNSVNSLGYVKYYCLRPIKSPSNSIRHNFLKIQSLMRGPEITLQIRKSPHFFW